MHRRSGPRAYTLALLIALLGPDPGRLGATAASHRAAVDATGGVVEPRVDDGPRHERSTISLSNAVAQLRYPLGERYLAPSPKSGPRTPVVLGPCPVCSHEPHVRLEGGGRREGLPGCG